MSYERSIAGRSLNLPYAARSEYGAFPPEQETAIVAQLRANLSQHGLDSTALLRAYQDVVSRPDRIQAARAALTRLNAQTSIPADLSVLAEILYFSGNTDELRQLGILFPAYQIGQSYGDNAGKAGQPRFVTLQERPRVDGGSWYFLGRKIGFPLGLAPSPLTDNADWIAAYASNGFNVFTYRTVRDRDQDATSPPNWVFLDDPETRILYRNQTVYADRSSWIGSTDSHVSTANLFGLPSGGHWREDLERALADVSDEQLLIVSVIGDHYEDATNTSGVANDFCKTAVHAEASGAEFVELNLSCPNTLTASGGFDRRLICDDLSLSVRIIEKVRQSLQNRTRLIVKLADLPSHKLSALVGLAGTNVDAYAGVNAVQSLVTNQRGSSTFTDVYGGVSGYAIRDQGLQFVRDVVAARIEHNLSFQVLGMGGVTDPQSFASMYEEGADVVQVASVAMANPLFAYDCLAKFGLALPNISGTKKMQTDLENLAVSLVRKTPQANQYWLASRIPGRSATALSILDRLVDRGVLVASPASARAYGENLVKYSISESERLVAGSYHLSNSVIEVS